MRNTISLKIKLIIGGILLFIVGSVAGFLLGVGPFGINPLIARGLYGAATFQVLLDDYQAASKLFELALNTNPKLTDAHYQQMWISYYLDDPDAAHYHAQRVLDVDPDNSSAVYYSMYSQYTLDNYQKALVYLERALELPIQEEDQVYIYAWAVRIYSELYDTENTIFYGEKVLELDPDFDDTDLYWKLVNAYTFQEDHDKSLLYLDKLAELTPDDPDIYGRQGNIYADMGDFDRAAEAMDTVIEMQPDEPESYFQRGILANRFEYWEEALDYFEQTLAIDPDYIQVSYYQAEAYYMQGDRDAAYEALYKYYYDEVPEDEISQAFWADFLVELGETDEAILILLDILEEDPTDYYAQDVLTNIYYFDLETPDAIEDVFTSFIEQHPDQPEFYLLRGDYYAGWTEDYERAEADYLRYLEAVPDDPEGFLVLADYYEYYLEDYQHALDAYTQAIALNPENVAELYCWRADTYQTLGDIEAALSDLTTSLELDGADYCRLRRAEMYANELDDPESAIDDYTFLIENEPDMWQSLIVERGKLYIEIGDYTNAEADFLTLAESEYDYTREQGYMWLGRLYHHYLNKPDEALAYYEQVSTLAEYLPLFLYFRGDLYYSLGEKSQAEDDFRMILEDYPYFLEDEGADYASHPLWAEIETGE